MPHSADSLDPIPSLSATHVAQARRAATLAARTVAGTFLALGMLALGVAATLTPIVISPAEASAPVPFGFADEPPLEATFYMGADCASDCAGALRARQSHYLMTDGSRWVRTVYSYGDGEWTAWHDADERPVPAADLPPMPASL